MRLLDILQRHLDLEYQQEDLLASNIFSRAGKKLSRAHKKAVRRDRVLRKCNVLVTGHSTKKVVGETYKKTLKPVGKGIVNVGEGVVNVGEGIGSLPIKAYKRFTKKNSNNNVEQFTGK
jgi:hypothetical protein